MAYRTASMRVLRRPSTTVRSLADAV